MDNKILTYISYGDTGNNLKLGSFDEVPENALRATITLKFPSKHEEKSENFYHRKLCGTKLPATVFLDTYSKRVTIATLMKIKEQIENGETIMFIPLGKSFEDYEWINEKDSVYETREAFVSSIYDFKNKLNDKFQIADDNDLMRK